MSLYAGIDVGSRTTKACILKDMEIFSSSILDTTANVQLVARRALEVALEKKGIQSGDLSYIVATGYGRVNVPFANTTVTEISCHALGINFICPTVRTILDMGGQDIKVIRCDEEGRVLKFVMNDKCAAGTGRFIERVAHEFNLTLETVADLSLNPSSNPYRVNSYCAVFAIDDALSSVRRGVDLSDVLAGLIDSLVERILYQVQRIGLKREFAICGGIARNKGVVERIRRTLGFDPVIPFDPQIIGALGAALFARRLHKR